MHWRQSTTLLIALVFPCIVAAQVQIDGVDSNFQSGSIITIDGSGFGTKEFSSPWLWDDLTHSTYSNLSDGDYIPSRSGNSYGYADYDGVPDAIDPNALYKETTGWPAYRTTHPQQRVPGRAVISCEGNGATLFDIGRPHGDTEFLYLDYWFYSTSARTQPIDGVPGRNYNKIFRVSPSTSSYNTYGHTSVYPGRISYDEGIDQKSYIYESTYPVEGKWTHISVWTDGSRGLNGTPGESNGIFKIWVDNELVIDISDQGYKQWPVPGDVHGYSFVHAIGIETAGGDSDHSPPYANLWGDIYIDNSQSRVALGDAPTWSAVEHFELQIPQNWSSNSIQVKGNLGSFSSGPVWLYVIDGEGRVNNDGHSVTIVPGEAPEGPGTPGTPSR